MLVTQASKGLAGRLKAALGTSPGWEWLPYAVIALAALGLRLWELDGRTMHYDESLHAHYAWRLAIGDGYSHSPWMHGPFQVHLVAGVFKLFSDSDFTARLGYVLFGSALVALPYFLRTYLGRAGALVTSVLLALSPTLLYLSRFGRNEILMTFWALALLILIWRYLNEGKNRYLYMASAVLALALATKETSYILIGIFGLAVFLLAIPQLIPWAMGRIRLSEMRTGPPALLVLMVSLTLPQWSALSSIPLGTLGLDLVSEGVGEVGLPALQAPYVIFPLIGLPVLYNSLALAGIVAIPLGAVLFTKAGRRWMKWLLLASLLGALAYAVASFTDGLVARNYVLSFGVLFGALVASIVLGVVWHWRVWLVCAGIFYSIWATLYTSVFGLFVQDHGYCPTDIGSTFGTLCTKVGGLFTGSWQGLGYWLTQQDVARGGQPWYYQFLMSSVYEFLPLLFGAVAIVYYLRKGELFGQLLGFWAVLTFFAYMVAGEKMPWLLANIALPFIILSGKFIGELIERVRWRRVLKSAPSALLLLSPMLLLAGVYLLQDYLEQGRLDSWQSWGLLVAIAAMAGTYALLVKKARPRLGVTLGGLGIAALLLGFSSFVAFRASYNYDDDPVEMLLYAQGSADIVRMVETLNNGVMDQGGDQKVVNVDYEMWYPMNWYVRHEEKEGSLKFRCYKDEKEDGYAAWCSPLEEPPSTQALLLIEAHANRDGHQLSRYDKSGPFKNLLWFPETYRRPGENRTRESVTQQLKKDFHFVKDTVTSRGPWKDALDYFLHRRLATNWWDSRFYSYIATEPQAPVQEAGG